MADTNTILIGAAGVIIGALITQIFSAVNNYFSDKRKYNSEQRQALLIRKMSIGEDFYALNGLAIQSFKKSLHYFETVDNIINPKAIEILEKSMNERSAYLKTITEREKAHTAINLYYKIQSNFEKAQDFENSFIGLLTGLGDINPEDVNAPDLYSSKKSQLTTLLRTHISMIEKDRAIIEDEIDRIMDEFFN